MGQPRTKKRILQLKTGRERSSVASFPHQYWLNSKYDAHTALMPLLTSKDLRDPQIRKEQRHFSGRFSDRTADLRTETETKTLSDLLTALSTSLQLDMRCEAIIWTIYCSLPQKIAQAEEISASRAKRQNIRMNPHFRVGQA